MTSLKEVLTYISCIMIATLVAYFLLPPGMFLPLWMCVLIGLGGIALLIWVSVKMKNEENYMLVKR
jgi:hypothetical protein